MSRSVLRKVNEGAIVVSEAVYKQTLRREKREKPRANGEPRDSDRMVTEQKARTTLEGCLEELQNLLIPEEREVQLYEEVAVLRVLLEEYDLG